MASFCLSRSLSQFPLSSPQPLIPPPSSCFSHPPPQLLTIPGVVGPPAAFLGKYSPPVLYLSAPLCSHHQQTLDVTAPSNFRHMWRSRLQSAEAFCFSSFSSLSGFWLTMTIQLSWIKLASALRSSASHATRAHTVCRRWCVCVRLRAHVCI